MAVRPILFAPDPALKHESAAVSPNETRVAQVIQDMMDTLSASPGVALAAPQIGELVQIIVVDVSRKKGEQGHGLVILLNPRIVDQSDERMIREG